MSQITDSQKVAMYECLLHEIQIYSDVTLDRSKLAQLIKNISSWSYAHRCGNGELSESEQQNLIDKAFYQLRVVH